MGELARLFSQVDAVTFVTVFTAIYGVAAAGGFLTHRGAGGWRAVGAVTLVAVAVADAAADAALLNTTVGGNLDTALGVAAAIGACVLAGYFWTHRTATPNPLGSDRRPFDY
mgnify:CR=1 FL=1